MSSLECRVLQTYKKVISALNFLSEIINRSIIYILADTRYCLFCWLYVVGCFFYQQYFIIKYASSAGSVNGSICQ